MSRAHVTSVMILLLLLPFLDRKNTHRSMEILILRHVPVNPDHVREHRGQC